jgi:hypothetical protein
MFRRRFCTMKKPPRIFRAARNDCWAAAKMRAAFPEFNSALSK